MSESHSENGLELAQAMMAEQELPFPSKVVDPSLTWQAFNETVFATQPLTHGPYALENYTGALLSGEQVEDYSIFGIDGHGTNSWALHYYSVQGPLALFIQTAWGGAYTEVEKAAEIIQQRFEWAEALQGAVKRVAARGDFPSNTRLLVVLSDFSESGWAWVRSGETTELDSEHDVFVATQEALASLGK